MQHAASSVVSSFKVAASCTWVHKPQVGCMTLCLHVLRFTISLVRLTFCLHPIADDMQEDERQLWTEQILQWMCSPDTTTEIRFACGQALTGALSCSCWHCTDVPGAYVSCATDVSALVGFASVIPPSDIELMLQGWRLFQVQKAYRLPTSGWQICWCTSLKM